MIVFLGMVLDGLLGEPKWLWSRVPHPAVLMGRAVGWCDARFNEGEARKLKGITVMAALALAAMLVGFALAAVPGRAVDVVVLAILLAHRSLSDHVKAVAAGLRQSREAGRRAVAQIVGRDTTDMDEPAIARAAIESAAENFSDGVIAPLFWFIVAGLPGLLLYKITNTADSTIGYLSPRHAKFGWAAAKLDDVLNWVPARLTAGLVLLAARRAGLWQEVWDDAPLHRSPNAGWPEAAFAHSLHVALSGPRSYGGTLIDYPFVNPRGIRELGPEHVQEAVDLLWVCWAVALFPAFLVALF